ncbi:unnamed protein product, partial [Prorocentrum cordatum]
PLLELPLDRGHAEALGGGGRGGAGEAVGDLRWALGLPPGFAPETWDLLGETQDVATASVVLLHMAWTCVLGRMARSSQFVSGVGFGGPAPGCGALAEAFPSTVVPMVVSLEGEDGCPCTGASLAWSQLAALRMLRRAARSSGAVDWAALLARLGRSASDASAHPLFQTAFVIGPPLASEQEVAAAARAVRWSAAPLTLQLRVRPQANGVRALAVQLLFWQERWSAWKAPPTCGRSCARSSGAWPLAGSCCSGRCTRCLRPTGRARRPCWLAATGRPTPPRTRRLQMHTKFLECARWFAGSRALVDCREDGSEDGYTYQELHGLVRRVASELQRLGGAGLDGLVPLLFERGVRTMVVAIYATLVAGGAYVPLEDCSTRPRASRGSWSRSRRPATAPRR